MFFLSLTFSEKIIFTRKTVVANASRFSSHLGVSSLIPALL